MPSSADSLEYLRGGQFTREPCVPTGIPRPGRQGIVWVQDIQENLKTDHGELHGRKIPSWPIRVRDPSAPSGRVSQRGVRGGHGFKYENYSLHPGFQASQEYA
ncbi:hypothetical protein DSO57_1006784 [Entomophthora muscae]|uniref:Uncharacterized protein n=1 Tax=Entomophthora muscae TaxID=34485 RepID=A0ACC2S9F5_9FUNG|nr:hypothetical protein DSO57_1006784 [Entomophthora muscae]